MKRSIIAAMFTLAAGAVVAQPLDFQRQFNAEEYVWDYDSQHIQFAPVSKSDQVPSLTRLIVESNVDGIALNDFNGTIVESGPTRISLYEVFRDSPEGIAYADYHARFPVDTDWDAIAEAHRGGMQNELAAEIETRGDAS